MNAVLAVLLLGPLVMAAAAITILLMTWGNNYPVLSEKWWRISNMRVSSIIVIAVVTLCQSFATVTFQTVTNNRIITPSIMGFESLFVLIQTSIVFFLGTSGIVEPMSQQAILDTIQLEMNQAALRTNDRRLILAPGNYGLDYLHDTYPAFAAIPVVKTSNFIGDTLDMAASAGFEQVLLVGHVGKLVKVAGGIMNTHSHTADCRTELFCTHAALCGASREVCAALMNAATTDACLELLDSAGLRAPVLESLLRAVQLHLDRRACGAFRVGAVLFSNQHGPLGATDTAAQLLNEWKEH